MLNFSESPGNNLVSVITVYSSYKQTLPHQHLFISLSEVIRHKKMHFVILTGKLQNANSCLKDFPMTENLHRLCVCPIAGQA